MSILNITNHGTNWRVFEKENLEKYFGEVIDVPMGSDVNGYEDVDYVIWRPNTEETTSDELNWMLETQKVLNGKSINSPDGFLNYHAKELAFSIWKDKNVPCPDFFEYTDADDFMSKINFEPPFLIRLNNQVSGHNSYLINNEDELNKHFYKLDEEYNQVRSTGVSTTKKICVKFINTRGDDGYNKSYRIIVAGNKIITGYARLSRSDDWIAITEKFTSDMSDDFVRYQKRCQEICEVHEEVIVNAVQSLGLNLQGVDVIEDTKGNISILEVQPGFSTGYASSGGPFYNPNYPELVSFLTENEKRLRNEIPMYYNKWLDKNNLFDLIFRNIKEVLK